MNHAPQVAAGRRLNGYKLLRVIGEGGFGKVWLCHASFTGELKAIKIVNSAFLEERNQEYKGLVAYKEKALWMRSHALMPVEHANALADGFFYVMPLADGLFDGVEPRDENWRAKTLAACIQSHKESGGWFTSQEIRYFLTQLLGAAQTLEQAGLVHRDIKPENVLFLGQRPVLGDCGLVGPDKVELTRRGTPGYAAPRYYLDSGGSPDMYGLGALLYVLLTGRNPDSSNLSARRAYWWPPGGDASLSEDERQEWLRLRNVVLKALDEEMRYVSLGCFAEEISGEHGVETELESDRVEKTSVPGLRFKPSLIWALLSLIAILLLCGAVWHYQKQQPPTSQVKADAAATTVVQSSLGISNERLAKLNAIVKEAQDKLDAFNRIPGDCLQFNKVLDALNHIDARSPKADQQLTDFLAQYSGVHIPQASRQEEDDQLGELFGYYGRICDWAKTDPEKQLALVRAMDFQLQLNEPHNNFVEGMANSSMLNVTLSTSVETLSTNRQQAAREREINAPAQQVAQEGAQAADFVDRLYAWEKTVLSK